MARNAYVTFLAGKGDYVMGVVGLAKSLRKHNAAYPLVVAVLSDVPEEHRQLMLEQGCILRDILPVDPPPTVTTTFSRAYFALIYSKFPIWEFVEYERIVFLDADMQIFDNIDNLFDLPKGYLYAVVSCFCEPGWKETPQYKIGYCQQFADKMEWPAHLGLYHPNYFNAGLFVFEPSVSTYRDMLKTLAVTPCTAFAEQFVEYERIVFLDADMQIFDNIDHLFDLPKGYLYAVVSCFCEPGWKETPQYKIGYCQQFADKMEWPAHLGLYHPNYFNSGVFVFEPSVSTYRDMLKTLAVTPSTAYAEQDFLNLYFKDKFKPLPLEYNLMVQFLWRHPTKVDLNKAKVVHYCVAGLKPWRHESLDNLDRDDLKKLVKLWWDVYNDASLDYNPKLSKISI